MFGCQFSETGLFRTQKADGIMGLSANSLTLVPQMKSQRKNSNQVFSLCFMKGGGIMTIGGADPAIQSSPMVLVPTTKSSGWFTVHLDYVSVGGTKLDVQDSVYNSGKGVIVDSGTTDTYLPRKMAGQFKKAWKDIVGKEYGNTKMTFSDEQFAKLPVISFAFKDVNGKKIEIGMHPDAYMEKSAKQYVPRVYVNEGQGAVLGANFMQDYNVLFDQDNKRVGFARSNCNYENHVHVTGGALNAPSPADAAPESPPEVPVTPAAPEVPAPPVAPTDAAVAAPADVGMAEGDKTAIEAKVGTPVPQLVDTTSRLSVNGPNTIPALPSAATEASGVGDAISADHGPRPFTALLSVLVCIVAGRTAWSWYSSRANKDHTPSSSLA